MKYKPFLTKEYDIVLVITIIILISTIPLSHAIVRRPWNQIFPIIAMTAWFSLLGIMHFGTKVAKRIMFNDLKVFMHAEMLKMKKEELLVKEKNVKQN